MALTPTAGHFVDSSPIQIWERVVSRFDCRLVVEAMRSALAIRGPVLRSGRDELDRRLRTCLEHGLPMSSCRAVVSAMHDVVAQALMCAGWQDGKLDGPKFCSYSTGDYFRSHRDNSHDGLDPPTVRTRRLSVVCFLNDDSPSDGLPVFDGGALVIHVPKNGLLEPVVVHLSAGSLIVFRAELLHEVRPVRSGVRYSAIAWVHDITERKDELCTAT